MPFWASRRACATVVAVLGATVAGAGDRAVVVQYPNPATFQAVQERLAARFEAHRPDIDIQFAAPASSYDDMLHRSLRGYLSGNLPDVAFFAFATVDRLVERGILPPLRRDELARIEDAAGGPWRLGRPEYCVPFAVSVPALFVNRDLLEPAGRPLDTAPSSWREIAARARAAGRLPGNPDGIWLPIDRLADWTWQILLNGRGGSVRSAGGAVTAFRGPEAAAAMQDYALLTRSNYYYGSSNQAIQAFVGGRLAMLVGSNAVLERIRMQIGGRFTLDVWPTPVTNDQGRRPAGGNCVAIFAEGREARAAAVEYAAFLVGAEAGGVLARSTGYFPAGPRARQSVLADARNRTDPHLLPALEETRLVPWAAYPGRGGARIPEVIHRMLERLALDPSENPIVLLDRLAEAEDRLAANPTEGGQP